MSSRLLSSLAGFYRLFARNASFLVAYRTVGFLVNLFLIPYIIAGVGTEGYGIFAAAGAIAALVGAFDLGLGSASIKFLAEQVDRGDCEVVNRTFWSAFVLLAMFSAVLFVVAIAAAGPVLWLFRVPPTRLDEAFVVYAVMVGAIILSIPLRVFHGLIWALHRVDLISWLHLGMIPLYAVGMVWTLNTGRGLVGIACVEALTMFTIPSLGVIWIASAAYPQLQFSPHRFNRVEALRLLKYGARIQTSILVGAFYDQAGRFVAGSVLGLRALTFYDLAARLAQPISAFPTLIAPLFVPISSQLGVREETYSGVRELYQKGTKLIAVFLVPAVVFGSVFSAPIISAWMGPGYGVAAFGFACFLWLNLFDGVSRVGRALARGVGLPGLETRFEVGRTATTIPLALLGCWWAGLVGLVLTLTMTSIAACGLLMWRLCRLMGVTVTEFGRRVFGPPAIAATAAVTVAVGLSWVEAWLPLQATRASAAAQVVSAAVVFLIGYATAIVWTGHLTPRDLWAAYRGKSEMGDADRITS